MESGGDSSEEVQELALSTAKSGVIYLAGEIGTSIITLVLLIYLARALQPSSFGFYSIAISFSGFLGIASNFGMGTAFRKMLPELKKNDRITINKIVSNGYYLAMLLGLVIAAAGFLLSGFIAIHVYHNQSLGIALELAAISELISVVFNLGQGALVGLGLVNEATIANVAYSVFYLIGSVVLVVLGYGFVGAVWGYLIGLIFGCAFGQFYLYMNKVSYIKPEKRMTKEVGKFSGPVVASNVAIQGAQNFAVLFLGVFAVASVVGNYGSAFKLARFVELTITSITFILLAAFSKALAKKETAERIGAIYNNSLYYTSLIMYPIIAYGIALSSPLVRLLFSSTYASAPFDFAFIIGGMGLGLIGTYAGTLIIGSGDTKRFMRYQVFAVVIQFILLIALTPFFKTLGVLIGLFAVTPIVLNVIYIRALEDQFRFRHRFGGMIRVTISSAILCIILYLIAYAMHQSKWSLIVGIAIAAIILPVLLSLTKGISKENIDFIGNTGKRLRQFHYITDFYVRYMSYFIKS